MFRAMLSRASSSGEYEGTEKHNERQKQAEYSLYLENFQTERSLRGEKGGTYLSGELSQPFRFLHRRIPPRCNLDLCNVPVKRLGSRRESHGQLVQLLKGIRTSAVTSDSAHLPLFRGEEGAAAHQDVPAQTDRTAGQKRDILPPNTWNRAEYRKNRGKEKWMVE